MCHRANKATDAAKEIRVLFIQGVTIPGGAHRSLILLANGLRAKNIIPVVATSRKGFFTDLLEKNSIEYRIIPMGMWRKGKNLPKIPNALYKLFSLIRRERVNLVHANTIWDNPYSVFPARWAKVPAVCHIRSQAAPDMVSKYFLRKTDRTISISRKLAEPISPLLRIQPVTVYNGVDTKIFNTRVDPMPLRAELGLSGKEPLIGIVSRIDPLKGQKIFLEAAQEVHTTHPDAKFLIVGGYGQKQEWFAKRIKNTVLSEPFRSFCFYLDRRNDVEHVFSAIDIHVLPSFEEGLGMCNLEAMASGKPVISTKVGGIPEYLTDGENGFLVPHDSSILAGKIRLLLDSPSLREKMGQKANKRVCADFSLEKYISGIHTIYKSLLQHD